jgi:hypothetical protein
MIEIKVIELKFSYYINLIKRTKKFQKIIWFYQFKQYHNWDQRSSKYTHQNNFTY